MRNFILRLLFFIAFFLFFYSLSLLIVGNSSYFKLLKPNINFKMGSYGHTYSRLSDAKQIKSVDILVVGSSHAYRGVDNRYFAQNGISMFNLGTSAQGAKQTEILLNRYLLEINPKKVIYIVSPLTLSGDGLESSIDLVSNDINDIFSYDLAFDLNHLTLYNTLFYSDLRHFTGLNEKFKENAIKGKDKYIKGGYVEREISFYKQVKEGNKRIINFNEEQIITFENNIRFINEKNLEVILVHAPITKDLYKSYSNFREFDSIMNKFNHSYYNFNEIIDLSDSLHFYDSNHLNQNGVEIFNEKLFEVIN